MARATIPVDLFNPGQVFACLGFLEAADVLCGDAEGGFDWSGESRGEPVRFVLEAAGESDPVAEVLRFLAEAEVEVSSPHGVDGPWPPGARPSKVFPAALSELLKSDGKGYSASALPIALTNGKVAFPISNWLEGDGRKALKLFAGKQIGAQLAGNMLKGDAKKTESVGYRQLYPRDQERNFKDPFGTAGALGGRFGYDASGAWDAMRIGMSLDKQGYLVVASPCVELLALLGLEHARPTFPSNYEIRYATWSTMLPVSLARAALAAGDQYLPPDQVRRFRAHLGEDKQYKKCFPAQEEPRQ